MDLGIRARSNGFERVKQALITDDRRGGVFANPSGHITFQGVRFEHVDFQGLRFEGFLAEGAVFLDCDFRRASFATRFAARFGVERQSVFMGCRFDHAFLRRADLGQARFERCTFDNAQIEEWFSHCGEFVDCHFAGRMRKCVFYGRPYGTCSERLSPRREANEFRGNDFREADLVDVSFEHGIDVFGQRWPGGPEYVLLDRIKERIEVVRAQVARWPDDREREDALLILRIYSSGGYAEQHALFTRRDDIGRSNVREHLWRMLETATPKH